MLDPKEKRKDMVLMVGAVFCLLGPAIFVGGLMEWLPSSPAYWSGGGLLVSGFLMGWWATGERNG